ncbi:MAG: hypothetical protein QXI71_06660, partial [Candidatus Bathyarchaeia archaeon]
FGRGSLIVGSPPSIAGLPYVLIIFTTLSFLLDQTEYKTLEFSEKEEVMFLLTKKLCTHSITDLLDYV